MWIGAGHPRTDGETAVAVVPPTGLAVVFAAAVADPVEIPAVDNCRIVAWAGMRIHEPRGAVGNQLDTEAQSVRMDCWRGGLALVLHSVTWTIP